MWDIAATVLLFIALALRLKDNPKASAVSSCASSVCSLWGRRVRRSPLRARVDPAGSEVR